MTPLEGIIIQQAKRQLEVLRAILTNPPGKIEDIEFGSAHDRLSVLVVLGHLAGDGMSCEASQALLSIEREVAKSLSDRPSWAPLPDPLPDPFGR